MTDENTSLDNTDEVVQGDQVDGTEGDAGNLDTDGKSDKDKSQSYLGTFKTKEEAEKGWRESQSFQSRLQSERDQARSEIERLNSQVLGKLTEAITQKGESQGKSQTDIEADIERAAAEIESGGGKAAIQWMSRYAMDAQDKAEARVLAKLAPQIKALEERLAKTADKSMTSDPEYQAYKSEISALEKLGITDKEMALKMAKAIKPRSQPNRPAIPGSATGGRARVEDDDAEMSAGESDFLTAELNKVLKKPLTQAEMKQVAKARVTR